MDGLFLFISGGVIMTRKKCGYCKGTGFVPIGPNIRGIKICPMCGGGGVIIDHHEHEYIEIKKKKEGD